MAIDRNLVQGSMAMMILRVLGRGGKLECEGR